MKGAVGFGVFSVGADTPRVGFRVAEGVLDLGAAGLGTVFEAPTLNPFLALGRSSWEDTLARVDELVSGGADLVSLDDTRAHLPFAVADYVDFYSSLEHATNLGRLFRPDAERSCRTGATSPSATTGAPERSSSAERRSCVRVARRRPRPTMRRATDRAGGSTSSSSSGSSWASAARSASRSVRRRFATTSSESRS